ncbi:MAG: hypothetical protein ABJB47_07495 [Actinomycetota bacterium]
MPQPDRSVVAVPPPGAEPGTWAGAPSAARSNGDIYLAYRLRRPIGQGRGYAIAVARSADGVKFETILTIGKDEMGTESLERPALVLTPDGTWRLYVSCATTGTKHWRVELLEADDPAGFDSRQRRVILPGDERTAVKDPVIKHHDGQWHLWASAHPLTDPDQTDRMVTDYASSPDGVDWTWQGTALSPRPGEWDARGVRVSAVRFAGDTVLAYYDGRATAAENYEERTGAAAGSKPTALQAVTAAGVAESTGDDGPRGLRYLDIVDLGDGHERWYYELTRPDGAHELRTELH